MKRLTIIWGLLFLASYVNAQIPADAQKKMEEAQQKLQQLKSSPQYKEAMQKAQQAMQQIKSDTNVQKQMSETGAQLEALKKDHPEICDIKMPDLNKMQIPEIPDLDSLNTRLTQSAQKIASLNKAIDQTTPKPNPSHHADKLPRLSETGIRAIVQQELGQAEKKLNAVLLSTLKNMVKDTSTNIATTGAFILASGGDKNAAVYLICSAMLKNPDDEWAINDMGVYFRDINNLERSLQCYFYADSLYATHPKDTKAASPSSTGASGFTLSQYAGSGGSPSSVTINTNIGWASAYYGDFETALKYFDKALAANPDFQSANEGKALVAYAKGDIAALFQCLAKEIKYVGGTGGPSASFAEVACKAATDKMNQEPDKDPSQDHTFDNSLPDEAPNTPPGADVDDVTLTQYKKVFVNKPEEIAMAVAFGVHQINLTHGQLAREIKKLTAQLRTLKPLGQKPYIDEEGYLIYPSNFEKYVIPLTPIETSYDNRIQWWQKKFFEKLKPFVKDVHQHEKDLIDDYFKELGKCPFPDEGNKCQNRVSCKWAPIIYKSENSDLEALSRMWDDYYRHVFGAVNWYLKATAPFISRVHQVGWNDYLNAYRKYKVKIAYIELYSAWVTGMASIEGIYGAVPPKELTTCNQSHNAIPGDAPDPFSKKPDHIKEYEGKCYNMSFDIQVGTINSNCHADKFKLGNDRLNLCYAHTTDPIAAENQGYANDVNFTASAEKEFKIAEIGGKDVGVTGGVKGNVDMKFDNDWNFTGGKSSVSATADVGHVHIAGAEASRTATAEVVSGQRQVNISPLSVTTSGPSLQ